MKTQAMVITGTGSEVAQVLRTKVADPDAYYGAIIFGDLDTAQEYYLTPPLSDELSVSAYVTMALKQIETIVRQRRH